MITPTYKFHTLYKRQWNTEFSTEHTVCIRCMEYTDMEHRAERTIQTCCMIDSDFHTGTSSGVRMLPLCWQDSHNLFNSTTRMPTDTLPWTYIKDEEDVIEFGTRRKESNDKVNYESQPWKFDIVERLIYLTGLVTYSRIWQVCICQMLYIWLYVTCYTKA